MDATEDGGEMKFKIGDVVKLNSGGPLMTVHNVEEDDETEDGSNDTLGVTWIASDGKEHTSEFPAACVKKEG
jgi:uncharacterized protein YodC (DUF2158 family)